ncbi:hypothetical protein Tco_1342248, partial [Tanacetum coccineum]
VEFLPDVDLIVVLNDGRIAQVGTYGAYSNLGVKRVQWGESDIEGTRHFELQWMLGSQFCKQQQSQGQEMYSVWP